MKRFIIIGLLFGLILNAQTYWNMEEIWVKAKPDTVANFASSMGSGDINGDGYSDVMIFYTHNVLHSVISLFYGGNPMDTIPDLYFQTGINGDGFGNAFVCGDINGDGYNDLIVGASQSNKIYIYYGSSSPDTSADMIINAPVGGTQHDLVLGDINGDGYNDLAVGLRDDYEVYLYYGGPVLFDTIPDLVIKGDTGFAYNLSSGGDLNNDGFDDLVVGASEANGWQGKAFIYYGGNSPDTVCDLILDGTPSGALFSFPISLVSDVNGDGYDDIIAGEGVGDLMNNRIYLYYGGNPMDNIIDVVFKDLPGDTERAGYGMDAAGIKSADGDRYGDIVISEPKYDHGSTVDDGKGRVLVYTGSLSPDTVIDGYVLGIDSLLLGYPLAPAGDVDGDGKGDIMFSDLSGYKLDRVWICKYTGPSGFGSVRKPVKLNFQVELISPNPFLKETEIIYSLPFKGKVSINVYDELGRLVDRCVYGRKDAGRHRIRWGKGMKKGVYFIRINAETHSEMVEKTIKVVRL